MKDLTLDRTLRRGDRGSKVRLAQEWLTLHGFGLLPDGRFGPATEAAVREFQAKKRLTANGTVGKKSFEALVAPMRFVLEEIQPKKTLGATVVAYAKRHLKVHPREVGGQNMGPWVRLYMGGKEGKEYLWCAGFACFVLKQACDSLGVAMPIKASVSCDSVAASAKRRKIFLGERSATPDSVTPGSLFLVRRTPEDWTHIGIVIAATDGSFSTIEGNTNDEGSNEGYEVCARHRGYRKKDFIIIGGATPGSRSVMATQGGAAMTQQEKDKLWKHNSAERDKMEIDAGTVVGALLRGLERKETFIRLRDANRCEVWYDFVEGDRDLVEAGAKQLGFKSVSADRLEVHGA